MPDLTTAIKIACQAHENQKDKSGVPYILHPLRVMQKFIDEETMMVAVLHDVVEDSPFDLDFLAKEGFTTRILGAVDALTRRENEAYTDFIDRVSLNDLAVKVKIEDIKDNLDVTRLKHIVENDLQRIKKYHQALSILESRFRMSE